MTFCIFLMIELYYASDYGIMEAFFSTHCSSMYNVNV
jgi:hypothetical protein